MKPFIQRIVFFFLIPIVLLLVIYITTDPFKTIKQFDYDYYDGTNRDYVSTELFFKNQSKYNYDSFIFGSSRACGINTYQWRSYLNDDAHQFLFQSWSETLTGIYLKILYLHNNNIPIYNAIILFDIPGSFNERQLSSGALDIKHYKTSGQPFIIYQSLLFYNYIQKPTLWFTATKRYFSNQSTFIGSDTITNDYYIENKMNFLDKPLQDSLKNCSKLAKSDFLREIQYSKNRTNPVEISKELVNDEFYNLLEQIKMIFSHYNTNYSIIITPAYAYTSPSINPKDLQKIESIFEKEHVFNYSGENEYSTDVNNFSDPNHFGKIIGWHIIDDIYNKK